VGFEYPRLGFEYPRVLNTLRLVDIQMETWSIYQFEVLTTPLLGESFLGRSPGSISR